MATDQAIEQPQRKSFLSSFFKTPFYWEYLKKFYILCGHKHKFRIFILMVGAVLSGVIEILGLLVLYFLLKVLIGVGTGKRVEFLYEHFEAVNVTDTTAITVILGITIGFVFLLKNLYIILYYHFQHALLRKWKNEISSFMMEKYLNAPYTLLLTYNSTTLIRNINTIVGMALNGFVLNSLNFIANIITGLLILSILYLKYFGMTILLGAILVVSTYVQNLFLKKKSLELGKERDELFSAQDKNVYQGIHSIKETKVTGKENFFLKGFNKLNFLAVENDSKILFLSRLPAHITEMVIIVAIVTICIVVLTDSSLPSESAVSSLGVLAAIAFRISPIMNRTLSSLQAMNKNYYSMNTLFNEIEKLNAVSQHYDDSDVIKMDLKKSIRFADVAFRYPKGRRRALHGVDIEIKTGEFVGVVGESGAGKTTFIDVLLGLIPPLVGDLYVDDHKVSQENLRSWQKNLSFVPQSVVLSDDSIRKNIAFGIKDEDIDDEKIWQILRDVKLEKYVLDLEEGLDFTVGENGKNLSGGQKQRVGIARALYFERDVLVLDEATSALDVTTESHITDALSRYRGKKTVITIAHRLSTIKSADKIIFFHEGRVEGVGTFKQLYEVLPSFRKMTDLANLTSD